MQIEDDFLTLEEDSREAGAASFHFFTQDLMFYLKSGKWGPHIWKALDEESQNIMSNLTTLARLQTDVSDWTPADNKLL